MSRTKNRLAFMAAVVSLAVLATACGSSKSTTPAAASSTSAAGAATTTAGAVTTAAPATTAAPKAATTATPATTAAPAADLKASLQASGSTLQKAYEDEAIAAFSGKNKGVTIVYAGGGSGKGRTDLSTKTVDFAGSDSPYKDEDLAKNQGGDVLYFPILLGPITVSYNVGGVDKLQLSAPTIAKIFSRTIKTWDDAAIAADNPRAKLPATAITVVHRSDGSGTTDNFTKFLVAGGGADWTLKSGSTVEWPADTTAGNGNAGVAQAVKATDGAIGYVDLSDAVAGDLKFASVKNKAGKVVEPTSEAGSAAGDGITVKDNLTFSSVWADGDAAYPITAPSWIIVYAKQTDAAKAAALKAYVKYLLTDGQKTLKDLDYAPLPASLQAKAVAQLDKIVAG